jgi:predicted transcriptional regulator
LTNPDRVIPKFQRNVQVVSSEDTLARVLGVIAQQDYSQFPVYDGGGFRGLLTENGITRWLSQHVSTKLSLVELDDVQVREILLNEESRRNYHFLPRNARVDDTRGLFAGHPLLEAVLITASGKDSERLLGIATRWDITNLG